MANIADIEAAFALLTFEVERVAVTPEQKAIVARGLIRRLGTEYPGAIAEPPPAAIPPWKPMSAAEHTDFGDKLMGFGKHCGQPFKEIPRDYLEWLGDQSRELAKQLRRYLMYDEVLAHADDGTQ